MLFQLYEYDFHICIYICLHRRSINTTLDCSKFCVPTPMLDNCLESLFEFKINLLDYVTVGYILNMPFIFFM